MTVAAAQSPKAAASPAAAASAQKTGEDDEPCEEEAAGAAPAEVPKPADAKQTGQIGTLFDLLLRRCRDKSATVRSKALAGISKALAVPLEALGIGTDKSATSASGSSGHESATEKLAMIRSFFGANATTDADDADCALSRKHKLLPLLRARSKDGKAFVLKAVLQLLGTIVRIGPERPMQILSESDVSVVYRLCADSSVVVRKQAMHTMNMLFSHEPTDSKLVEMWLSGVLPMVNDSETTVQAYCLEMIESTVVKRIIRWHQLEQSKREASDSDSDDDSGSSSRRRRGGRNSKAAAAEATSEEDEDDISSVWMLLDAVQGPLVRCLQKSLSLASRSGNLDTRSLVAALQRAAILGTEKGAEEAGEEADKRADRYRYGAWVLLEGLSTIDNSTTGANSKAEGGGGGGKSKKSKIDIDFQVVVKCWQHLAEQGDLKKAARSDGKTDDTASLDSQRILRVLGAISSKIPAEVATELADSLMKMLHTFKLPPALTHGVIETLGRLCNEKAASDAEGRKITGAWCENLLQACEKGMANYMSSSAGAESTEGSPTSSKGSEKGSPCGSPFEMVDTDEAEAKCGSPYEMVDGAAAGAEGGAEGGAEMTPSKQAQQREEHKQHAMVTRYLFTLGEVAMVGFDQTADEKRRDPSKSFADEAKRGSKSNGGGECGTVVAVPKRVVTLVQALLAPKLHLNTSSTGGKSESGSTSGSTSGSRLIPSTVRAHAFMTLGKLCLVSSRLAKESVNVFVRELQCAAEPSVRSNILVIMNDLCTRYTFLVDRHIPSMARCLVDSNAVVRRHALILLSQLLLQEYIKWRGDLFFYFVMMMVDKDTNLRQMAYFTLSKPLLNRYVRRRGCANVVCGCGVSCVVCRVWTWQLSSTPFPAPSRQVPHPFPGQFHQGFLHSQRLSRSPFLRDHRRRWRQRLL
jgi:hypothetical protein